MGSPSTSRWSKVDPDATTTASDTSSEASRRSGTRLLDFIGAGFTGCFPCAVVDIDDGDRD
eukprot:CAMPEP_0172541018 /NCGR_PEP_ID=MMETSP1067-20121228/11910_1 /TAXON_ID=265564 ORGANISM="Thalassiosira punctigera, Strain Tpunct2005C2" /NCGR_SAMPLE_ID=MMETSP1067 /ASSEMBLY_ACC=CAM_ASM_000444 /LENGTH=60 /DNA_ID=CAMNT_0013326977 /DNA_START=12 /DNA_END=191 /DNA_ORIENTATION=-